HCRYYSHTVSVLLSSLYLLSFSTARDNPALHSFPTRRSSDLIRRKQCFGARCFPDKQTDGAGIVICRQKIIVSVPRKYNRELLRSEEHTSELQSRFDLVCRLLLEKKKTNEEITPYGRVL